MSDQYEVDIVKWSSDQGSLLRRRAAGELVNERELDWSNIAEEIESVGRSETRACRSFLFQVLLHDLKAEGWPLSRDVAHWRAEASHQRWQAREAFTPSMRQYINVATLYHQALKRLPASIDGVPPVPVPSMCSLTLDELLNASDDDEEAAL